MRAIWCAVAIASASCVVPLRIELPSAHAPVAERRSAYRWSQIAQIAKGRRGGRHAVLGDGREVDNLRALRVVGEGTATANALDDYARISAEGDPWLLGATGAMLGGFGAAAIGRFGLGLPIWTMFASIAAGFTGMGLCIHHASAIERRAALARDVVLGDYNRDLRGRLRLCTRDYQLADCDALGAGDGYRGDRF